MLFDSHCHLHFSQFDNDREKVIRRLKEAGVKVVNVGTDLEDSREAIKLSQKHPDIIWASAGIHPSCISTTNRRSSANSIIALDENLQINSLKELAKNEKVVAIGECGLDYFKIEKLVSGRTRSLETDYAGRQKETFIKQIELAKELNKPLILHCRPSAGSQDAYEDVINIIENFLPTGDPPKGEKFNGVAHFFSGTEEIAKKFLDLGFYIGFAGPITFSEQYKELVEFVPMDRILIETDAPFAAPVPHRGKRNEPTYVEFVARKIAEWKGLGFEEVARQTAENAEKLFRIK
jgi:TatD DNase family protein